MSKIKELFIKYQEVISYLFFGGCTFLVSIITFYLFNQTLGLNEHVAYVISWFLAVSFAYVTNKIWVFQSKTKELKDLLREMSAFVGARLFSFGFEMAWMYITAILIGINDTICKILAQFAIVVMNYVFSKLFIFKK